MPKFHKPGTFFRVPLADGSFGYGRVLKLPHDAFYAYRTETRDSDLDRIASKPVLWRIVVRHANKDPWEILGWRELEAELQKPVVHFMQDIGDYRDCKIVDTAGYERVVEPQECIGLESVVVWEQKSVEGRLLDTFLGRPNESEERLKVRLSNVPRGPHMKPRELPSLYKPGTFFIIPLPDGSFGYGRAIEHRHDAFYAYRTETRDADMDRIASKPVLCRIRVHHPEKDPWEVLGWRELEAELRKPIVAFSQDQGKLRRCILSDTAGNSRVVTPQECVGVEPSYFWHQPGVELRLLDTLLGRPNEELERLKVRLI